MRARIFAPKSYWRATEEEREAVCNGCGTKGIGSVIPEYLWGVCVTQACQIHDWMYHLGDTIEDKRAADRVFLNNMLRLIKRADKFFLVQRLQRRSAFGFYLAVRDFGGPAYWAGKNSDDEFRAV